MADTLERIWIESEGIYPYFYKKEPSDSVFPITEYVRADLYAKLEREVSDLRTSFFGEKEARMVDNAAKDARIKELEGEVFHDPELGITWKQICKQFDKECHHHQQHAEALEAKLAAAEKIITDLLKDHKPVGLRGITASNEANMFLSEVRYDF